MPSDMTSVDSDTDESAKEVFDFLKKEADSGKGIALNGVLVWIDVQQRSTPPKVWQAQALTAFTEEEISSARLALWKASEKQKELNGDMVAHRKGKSEKNLEDISKAMNTLRDSNALPLLLCSNSMVRQFPPFHCDRDTLDITDVVSKIKVVEESFNAFIKQNNEKLQAISDTIVKNAPSKNVVVVDDLETPGAKKRKVSHVNEPLEGISPLTSENLNFGAAARRAVSKAGGHGQVSRTQTLQNQHLRPNNHQQTPSKPPPRRNSALVYGQAKEGDAQEKFSLAADVNLVASGVSKSATPEQLKSYLISRGIQVTDIELLTKFFINESKSYTYRIAIKPEDYEKALVPEIWPHRVGVRLFKQKRVQQDQNWNPVQGQNLSQQDNISSRKSLPVVNQPLENTPLETRNRFDIPGFADEIEVFN